MMRGIRPLNYNQDHKVVLNEGQPFFLNQPTNREEVMIWLGEYNSSYINAALIFIRLFRFFPGNFIFTCLSLLLEWGKAHTIVKIHI